MILRLPRAHSWTLYDCNAVPGKHLPFGSTRHNGPQHGDFHFCIDSTCLRRFATLSRLLLLLHLRLYEIMKRQLSGSAFPESSGLDQLLPSSATSPLFSVTAQSPSPSSTPTQAPPPSSIPPQHPLTTIFTPPYDCYDRLYESSSVCGSKAGLEFSCSLSIYTTCYLPGYDSKYAQLPGATDLLIDALAYSPEVLPMGYASVDGLADGSGVDSITGCLGWLNFAISSNLCKTLTALVTVDGRLTTAQCGVHSQ